MEFEKTLRGRRSIRKFKADTMPEDMIRTVFDAARWAPSWGNTQPWSCYVVTGVTLEKFKEANRGKLTSGAPGSPEVTMPAAWSASLKQRYMDIGKSVLTALAIPREDKQARINYMAEMHALFGAPCMIIFAFDKSVPEGYAMLDVGSILQTVCLTAHDKGLGTCILAASVTYSDLLRELLPIPQDQTIAIGVALGYPDEKAQVNCFERQRAAVNDFVKWVK